MLVTALVLAICLLSLAIQRRVKPFKFEFQNNVEASLLVVNSLLLTLAFLFSEVWKPNREQAGYWVLTILMLLLIFGSLIFGIIRLRLWKPAIQSLKSMCRNESPSEIEAKEVELRATNKLEAKATPKTKPEELKLSVKSEGETKPEAKELVKSEVAANAKPVGGKDKSPPSADIETSSSNVELVVLGANPPNEKRAYL